MRINVVVAIMLISATALAADVGEIALIEDTDGSINQSVAVDVTYLSKITCRFFQSHPESFDVIFAFTTSPITMFGTPAGWAVKRTAKGIGYDVWGDQSAKYCSTKGRLKHAMKMGDLAKWDADPDAPYTSAVNGVYDGIEVMGHEIGHLWLAGGDYTTDDGARHCRLRAFTNSSGGGGTCDGYGIGDFSQHWSYFFDARSPMFGSFIDDLGGGQFKIYHERAKYGPLDQYLMGLRDKTEVPPMLVVDTGDLTDSIKTPLPIGQSETVSGQRITVTIDEVIRALGTRQPAKDPCHMKAAFVIVHPKGQVPSAQVVAKVDAYRTRWETWYAWATDDRGSFDTTLDGTGPGTASCPAGPAPDGGYPDAGQKDAGTPTDSGTQADAGGATDTGAPDDTGTTADGGGGQAVPCGQYSSPAGYAGRPCATDAEVCPVESTVCGDPIATSCTCGGGIWSCNPIDCVGDGGTVGEDAGVDVDGGTTLLDTGVTPSSDTGSKADASAEAPAGGEGGCSCTVIGL